MKLIILIFLLLTSDSWGAITLVQNATHTCSLVTSCSVTVSSTGSGNSLIMRATGAINITSVSDGTSNFTKIPYNAGNYWFLPKSNSGKTSMTVSYNTTVSPDLMFWEVSGFNYITPETFINQTGGSVSGGSATCNSITTLNAKDFIIAFNAGDGGATGTTGSFTFDQEDVDGNGYAHLITSSAGTNNAVFTNSGTTFSCFEIAFKDNGGFSRLIR